MTKKLRTFNILYTYCGVQFLEKMKVFYYFYVLNKFLRAYKK
jgi:hypothetical protein